ncbi:MAG: hypothetical protein RLY58_1470 [Pseudomonadota bacterium]|jgi:tRNA-binding EMAP/Myf-like protein
MNQATALNILKSGQNVFLTGSAGAGKTYTLNQYIHYLKVRKVPVAVTASTGIAATHMNGMTIHTWSGIGIKDSLDSGDLARMYERKYLRTHLDNAKVLIIDEVSMLHAKQLDAVNQVLKHFKNNDLAFGGIQVIVAGDFFQLPPVGKPEESNRDKFAFMAKAWVEAQFNICYLTEQHRQQDNSLNQILNEIRAEAISPQSLQLLRQTEHHTLDTDITRLFTHNVNVDEINQRQLAILDSKTHVFSAETKGNEKMLMTLSSAVRAPDQLVLKVGAKVMFVKNNPEQGYMNGTLGEVTSFINDDQCGKLPKVKLRDGSSLIVTPETWSIENDAGKALANYTQIPLCLAWAMTVHKSQGMTLEAAEIDLSNTFEKGQGYVALSRLKHLDGLRLLGFNPLALQLDRLAVKADQRFTELSHQAEALWATREAQVLHEQFVRQCGGTLDAAEIARNERKLSGKLYRKAAAPIAADTLQATKALYEQGLAITAIAHERQLTEATIINHVGKLAEQDATFDLARVRPDDTVVEAVAAAYAWLNKEHNPDHFNPDGSIKLRPIIDAVEQHMSYNEVRLALLFVPQLPR